MPEYVAPYPAAFVLNTDVAKDPGLHWVEVYQLSHDEVEFFNSFGRSLKNYKMEFLAAGKKLVHQNDIWQSALSTVCGQYCLFFLLRRASGKSFSNILHLFTDNKFSNDKMVCQYVNHHFKLDTVMFDRRVAVRMQRANQNAPFDSSSPIGRLGSAHCVASPTTPAAPGNCLPARPSTPEFLVLVFPLSSYPRIFFHAYCTL